MDQLNRAVPFIVPPLILFLMSGTGAFIKYLWLW